MTKFSAMARILSHLGDQLISSSTVALLELIKNAYDAGSPTVKIIINQADRTLIVEDEGSGMSRKGILSKYLVIGTTDRLDKKERIRRKMSEGETKEEVIDDLEEEFEEQEEKNEVIDMENFTEDDLKEEDEEDEEDEDNEEEDNKVPLGEKGLGRFATMKLGEKLVLFTRSKKSQFGSLLMINWNKFNYSSKAKLDEINVHLFKVTPGDISSRYGESFVKLKIYDIKDFYNPEEWTKKRFESFYKKNFMKYINPFQPNKGFQITLEIHTADKGFLRLTPEIIDRNFLEQAPYKIIGSVKGELLDASYFIRGEDDKEYSGRMPGIIQEIEGRLQREEDVIGPFTFEFYFYNRNKARLDKIKGYEDFAEKKRILDQYNGGIMIYRDNFRVLPYAEPGNDWLELDSKGFRASGIRFNTLQTVGTIHISSMENSNLKDQTNREGLVHNKAYENLKIILSSILKSFKNKIEDYYPQKTVKKGPVETEDIHLAIKPIPTRINSLKTDMHSLFTLTKTSDTNVQDIIKRLILNVENISREYSELQESVDELDEKIKEVENQQKRIFDLAGIGMTAETVAHEMRSYLGRINSYLMDLRKRVPGEKDALTILLHNTKALDLVVSRLDQQSITRRRTRSKISLVSVLNEVCKSKSITWKLDDENHAEIEILSDGECFVKANQGMIVQVFDNLLNNSHYWLQIHKKKYPNKKMRISILVNNKGIVEFSDNGTGISHGDARYIFEPFFTRKVDGEGRGLGLYIVSQILNFHHSEIKLSTEQNDYGNYHKFIIDFSEIVEE
ncbi:sensor histidine kinase [Paenibacillus filicis]|uniref:histidine kinase n=1 Tax=Paenibacillus filicis TaxID=669464 RepID=A0ABU9DPS3_9BACL